MGSPSSEFPDFPVPAEAYRPDTAYYAPAPRLAQAEREPARRYAIYLGLFLLTALSTTWMGGYHYLGFRLDYSNAPIATTTTQFLLGGLWYSVSILAILGAHEFGHYFACRYYGVNASLPYFLPVPLLTGTLGAFIRIRQPIASKRELFDIGIAGPIAGFLVAVPALFIGMGMSHIVKVPPDFEGLNLGEPLLFKIVSRLVLGTPPDGYSINMHPMAFAAWFGMLATALNLFPIGQLDGGHISYAVLGRRSTAVTMVMVTCLVGLTVFASTSWLVWTVLTVGMLWVFGPHHPRTFDEHEPLDRTRMWLALFALIMFVLCFTPTPIEPIELIKGH
jgi:membrane-associated protease RseP (regulator of RpoE activity)